jgi:hypothetical protein
VAAGADAPDPAAPFQKPKWSAIHSLGEVDPAVIRTLKSRFGSDDRLAERGAPFDATDVVSGKPRRRFVLAGRAAEGWFVAYEIGGRAHHLVLAVFDAASPPRVVLLARGDAGGHDDVTGWRLEVEDLRRGLREKQLSIENPRQPYY